MAKPKIALVHDYIKEYGGAERVLETLHEMYPDAPVYTLVYCPEFLGPHKERFKSWDIRESWVGYIPFKHKFISIFRLIAPFVFQSFNFSEYDVVIVSATGAYSPNMIRTSVKHKPLHVCYCHTPPRYLYGYATARNWSKNIFVRGATKLANHFLRMIDYMSSQRVDLFIANSENVKARIKKFYGKDATVVYPPVDTRVFSMKYLVSSKKSAKYQIPNSKYYLAGGRLARPKHIDLIVKACMELSLPLKIFGKGFAGYGSELRSLAYGSNIEFLGEVSDEKKMRLLAGARGYIFAGEDEDFGILPVEAMSVGTPVISYRSGGVVETIVEGKTHSAGHSTLRDKSSGSDSKSSGSATGIFFDTLSVESLKKAIKKFEKTAFSRATMVKQAEKFSKQNFEKGIREIINSNTFQTPS